MSDKGRVYEEHEAQAEAVKWARKAAAHCPALGDLYAIPNSAAAAGGAKPGLAQIKKVAWLKAEGLLPGTPDLCLPWPFNPWAYNPAYHALYIEMKSKNGQRSDSQIKRGERLKIAGNLVIVCRTGEECIRCLCAYLKIERSGQTSMLNDDNFDFLMAHAV